MINIKNIKWINDGINNIPFKKLTNIQKETIPLILKGNNIIGVSETGTGKTYCFLLPILAKIDFKIDEIQTIIIVPTRELARQIYSKFYFFKKYNDDIKIQLLIGGSEFEKTKNKIIKSKPQIIISTPEKFLELSRTKIKFNKVSTIVFDEADMLIDLGFISVFKDIFNLLSNNKNLQKIAFSATLHEMLSNQLSIYFKDTQIIDLSKNIWKNDKIKHFLIHPKINADKIDILKTILNNINPYFCIIFCNTIKDSEMIYKIISDENKEVAILHGGLESRKRKNIYKGIEKLNYKFLIATDLASRGLDIEGASHVISFDLPKEDLWYIHRSGRTGRYKYTGESYVIFDNKYLKNIYRLKNKGIDWENFKIVDNKLVKFNFKLKSNLKRNETEVDKKIKYIINTSNKNVKPGYKKKIKNEIKKIKQKEKRRKIDESVKKVLIIKYKKENAQKTKIKEYNKLKREDAFKNKKK